VSIEGGFRILAAIFVVVGVCLQFVSADYYGMVYIGVGVVTFAATRRARGPS
jgi:hypothetical protein